MKRKLRVGVVCLMIGIVTLLVLEPEREPVSLVGWVVFALGAYVFGLLLILVAVVVLMAAGCEVRWPE